MSKQEEEHSWKILNPIHIDIIQKIKMEETKKQHTDISTYGFCSTCNVNQKKGKKKILG